MQMLQPIRPAAVPNTRKPSPGSEVNLAVDPRDPAVGIDDHGAVVDLVPGLFVQTDHEGGAIGTGEFGEPFGLGSGNGQGVFDGMAGDMPVQADFGQGDQFRALVAGPAGQPGVELDPLGDGRAGLPRLGLAAGGHGNAQRGGRDRLPGK